MSDHLIAEANRHAKALSKMTLSTTKPNDRDLDWYVRECESLHERNKMLEAENADLHDTIDAVIAADERAVNLWRAAHPGNELVVPDRAKLVGWLLEQNVALRDYFAGQALAGLLAQIPGDSRRIAVGLAYRLADEMLVERERNGAQP